MKNRCLTFGGYFSLLTYGLAATIAGPALDQIRTTFEASSGQVGFLFTALSIGFICTVATSGLYIDRFSLKPASVAGQLILPVGLIAFGLSDSILFGSIAFFIIGVGGGLIEIATNTLISTLHSENRASSLNMLHLFFGFGALTGSFLSGVMVQAGLGWRTVFLATGFASLIVVLPLVLPAYPLNRSSGALSFINSLGLLKNSYMLLICLAVVLYVGIEMAINSWSVIYMETYIKLDKLTASSILSYFWILMTFGRILCAWLSRKIQAHNLLTGLVLLSCLTYPLFILSTNGVLSGISLALTGLSFSGIFPVLVALNSNRFPDMTGTGTGLMMSFMGLGLMLFPWMTGVLADLLSLQWSMRLLTIAVVVLFAVTVLLRLQTRSLLRNHDDQKTESSHDRHRR